MSTETTLPTAPVDASVMRTGLPCADAIGAYWWYKPDSQITPEPQALFVRWFRGAVRAVYGGQLVKVTSMEGQWYGPIPWPTCWETCEHGIIEGDWCPTCSSEYKRAIVENDEST